MGYSHPKICKSSFSSLGVTKAVPVVCVHDQPNGYAKGGKPKKRQGEEERERGAQQEDGFGSITTGKVMPWEGIMS